MLFSENDVSSGLDSAVRKKCVTSAFWSTMAASPVRPRRRGGLLAFLPDQVCHFTLDAPHWREVQRPLLTSARRSRRHRHSPAPPTSNHEKQIATGTDLDHDEGVYQRTNNTLPGSSSTTSAPFSWVNTTDFCWEESERSKTVVVWFLFDPVQPYSRRLLRKLIDLYLVSTEEPAARAFSCLVFTPPSGKEEEEEDPTVPPPLVLECLQGSGMFWTPLAQSSVLSTVIPTWASMCPSLMLVDARSGQKFLSGGGHHEELALEWNHDDAEYILDRWCRQHRSALSPTQQIAAHLLFPAACSIS